MANYTPTFTKPYPSGWVDKPSKTTPATAAIMNSYDTAIAALEAYLRDNAIDTVSVSVEQFPSDGREWLGTITVGSNQYKIYMPSLKYENSVSDGIKIGTITLGEQSFDVYAPTSSAGGSNVSVVPKTLTGTNIAEITVDGTTYQLYAPTGGGSGSTVTAEATLTEGTQIGKITIDGTETILYAPTASPITVDSELSTTSENAVQNKAIAEEFQKYENGTKVVAKAAEANTATTASNAEKVNGHTVGTDVPSNAVFTDTVYDDSAVKASIQNIVNGTTQVGSATKATQDAQGNVINETYAKKTEIPQGSVVDDALSSTSVNPVQNKVVKAEFDKVNSNLDGLGYGELCAYNILKPTLQTTTLNGLTCTKNLGADGKPDGTYTVNGTASKKTIFNIVDSKGIELNTNNAKFIGCPSGGSSSTYSLTLYDEKNNKWYDDYGNGRNISDTSKITMYIQIYSGVTVSNIIFKPMITFDTTATYDDYKPYIPSVKMLADEVSAQKNDLSGLKDGTTPAAKAVADEDGNNIKSTYAKKTEVPSGSIVDSELSATSENAIQNKVVKAEFDKVNSDLDKLNSLPIGSIIQIDEDKDDIETTTQKYGWQYLGKSNIQYEIGSANILVTNVYRKNN